MPCDDLPDVGMPLQDASELCPVGKDDPVHIRVKWIGMVVQHHDNGAIRSLIQPVAEPLQLFGGKRSLMHTKGNGTIKEDDALPSQVDDLVDKPGLGCFGMSKDAQKCLAIVMIADGDRNRDDKVLQYLFQEIVCCSLSQVGQVPGDNAEVCISVPVVDSGHTGPQPIGGIKAH